jgi:hypothetical protein
MSEQQKRLPSRRERRAQLKANGVLGALSKLGYNHPVKKQVREANQETGDKIHQAHVDRNDAIKATLLENRLNAVKEIWATQGYNEEELKMLEEAWVLSSIKDKETYKEDKKEVKRLRQAVKASREARTKN